MFPFNQSLHALELYILCPQGYVYSVWSSIAKVIFMHFLSSINLSESTDIEQILEQHIGGSRY